MGLRHPVPHERLSYAIPNARIAQYITLTTENITPTTDKYHTNDWAMQFLMHASLFFMGTVQPVPEKMRLEMVIGLQQEIPCLFLRHGMTRKFISLFKWAVQKETWDGHISFRMSRSKRDMGWPSNFWSSHVSSHVFFWTAHLKRDMNFDHRGFRFAFRRVFRVSSSREWAVALHRACSTGLRFGWYFSVASVIFSVVTVLYWAIQYPMRASCLKIVGLFCKRAL